MSGEDNEDMEDIRFVMDTCEVSADAARLLLSRCEWCVDEALECYFNGETTMEELELAAAKVNKGKVPACQYYWMAAALRVINALCGTVKAGLKTSFLQVTPTSWATKSS
eukprot:TRINITY_DN8617_c0_g1_i4.p3 TRINITY_DN8617_c0_g1~~TRINITY_DN8617_c0_g1_i4.p3  ORF type:complete len:110 (+),score=16.44 TRINITY_DN8617_c0_g1_i4:379-708(+)